MIIENYRPNRFLPIFLENLKECYIIPFSVIFTLIAYLLKRNLVCNGDSCINQMLLTIHEIQTSFDSS